MCAQSSTPPGVQSGQISVRVDRSTYARLVTMAEEDQLPIARIIAHAVDEYDRTRMLEESNKAYARLQQDPQAWAEWQEELSIWDAALMDGIDADE